MARTRDWEETTKACERLRRDVVETVTEFNAALECIDRFEAERGKLEARLRRVEGRLGMAKVENSDLMQQLMGFEMLWLRGKA